MGLPRHIQFISRTIFVQNNDVDKACRLLNRILSKEDIFGQYRRTRYYEKPTQVRRRINYERCKSIYNEDMDRKIKFLLRKNRIDPFPVLASCRGEECGHEELVRCARPLERISNSDLSFVTKKEDINKLCPDLEAGMKCIKKYTLNCMQQKQREHFNSLYTGTNMAIMELCQDGPYQDEFLKHAPCMQKSKAEYELLCYKSYQKTTQEIMTNGSLGQQNLKSLCCAFQEYLECSHHTVRRQCGDDTARFTKEFLDRMSSSLLKAHCAPYTECTVNSGISTLNLSAIMPMTLILLMRYFT
ncbi:RT21 protein, partial [Acromyrmex heyeri]